jgi:hypothetical protein
MTILRASGIALFVSSLLAIAWSMSAGGCGNVYVWICASPQGVDLGTDNTGDGTYGDCPCTCCLSGPVNGHPYPQGDCPFADAGDGGPLPCNGQCYPGPPLGWSAPLLLSISEGPATAQCPDVAPEGLFDGPADGGGFGVACTSTASGVCSGLADVCGPTPADGFSPCVSVAGDHACVGVSPYSDLYVFDEATFGPTTFCCLPSPLPPPPSQ